MIAARLYDRSDYMNYLNDLQDEICCKVLMNVSFAKFDFPRHRFLPLKSLL